MQEDSSYAILKQAYLSAAQASNIEVLEASNAQDYVDAASIFDSLWGGTSGTYVSKDFLRALTLVGGYVAVAKATSNNQPVAASFAFWGVDDNKRKVLHSDLLGVASTHQNMGIGYAMKIHQTLFAYKANAETVQWTFDPTIRRNSSFNFNKLGVHLKSHLPNFYERTDIDTGDRILVSLSISNFVQKLSSPISSNPYSFDGSNTENLIGISPPANIGEQRTMRPHLAIKEQEQFSRTLATMLEEGYCFIGLSDTGDYLFK